MKSVTRLLVLLVLSLAFASPAFSDPIPKLVNAAKAEPTDATYAFIRVKGDSMKATMPDGSLWAAAPAKMADVSVGDVVVFFSHRHGELVCHRVVRKEGQFYMTKGDSNNAEDGRMISNLNLRYKIVAAPASPVKLLGMK